MANGIDVNIRAHTSQADAAVKRFASTTEREATRVAARTKERFRDMAVNIAQNFSGAGSQIVGGLGRIPGVAGIAIAAVSGLAGAFLRLAQNTAEATKETSAGSRSFLVGMENLKTRVQDNLNLIGSKAIGVFNSFFDLIGTGATKQQLLNAETKRYNDLIITTVAKTDEYVAKIKEFIIASDRLGEAKSIQEFFKASEQGNRQLAGDLANRVMLFRTTDKIVKDSMANEAKALEENARKRKELEEASAKRRKELAEDIMGTIKKLGEAEREEMGKSIEAMDRALDRDRTEFQEWLERQRAGLKSPADVERDVNKELDKQLELQKEIKQQVGSTIASLGAAVLSGQDFNRVLESIIMNFLRLGFQALFKVPMPIGANGLIAMQHGSIVRRPTAAMIGEAGPEAVVPLSPGKARQRNEIMDAAGLSGGSVTLNISMPNIRSVDPITVRNVLLPEFNKQVRRGERLLSSKLR